MKSFSDKEREQELINKLKSLEVQPPSDLWDDIEKTLHNRSRKKILIYISYASAAAVALLISIGVYFLTLEPQMDITAKNEKSIIENTFTNQKKDSVTISIKDSVIKEIYINETEPVVTSRNLASNFKVEESKSKPIENNCSTEIINSIHRIEAKQISYKTTYSEKIKIAPTNQQSQSIAIASNEPTKEKKKAEWTLAASGYPVYAFHTSGITNPSKNSQEIGLWSMGGAITIRRSLPNNFSIESGILYNPLGQRVKNIYLLNSDSSNPDLTGYSSSTTWGNPILMSDQVVIMGDATELNVSSDSIVSLGLTSAKMTQLLTYIEIPIIFAKKVQVRQFSVNIKAGLTAGFLVGNKMKIESSSSSFEGKTEGVNAYLSSGTCAVGISIPFISKANLVVEPTLKLGLNTLNSKGTKSYPFSTSIKIGIEIPL